MFVFFILPSLYATAPPAIAMTENRSLFIASLLRRSTFSTFVVDYCKAIEQNEDTRSIQFSYLIPVAADRLQVGFPLLCRPPSDKFRPLTRACAFAVAFAICSARVGFSAAALYVGRRRRRQFGQVRAPCPPMLRSIAIVNSISCALLSCSCSCSCSECLWLKDVPSPCSPIPTFPPWTLRSIPSHLVSLFARARVRARVRVRAGVCGSSCADVCSRLCECA